MNRSGEKVGLVKVRLYRPFDSKRFVEALPGTVRSIAVLDRTKEPGAAGEPLFQDCAAAIYEGLTNNWGRIKMLPRIVGGRYGLSSKEFTPAMVKAVFDNLKEKQPKNHFTVGINDDVSHTSLPVDHEFSTEPDNVIRALFYGLGADGTVGANKNSIKIIGEGTENFAQGYFVYDSKKSGSMTVSHLRFGPEPIRSTYLVSRANFVACHLPTFLEKYDMVKPLVSGGTFLLNTPYSKDEIWSKLPTPLQESLIAKKAKFYVIDATKVARDSGMGGRINTIMQVCFFALSGVLPREKAIEAIKYSIKKTYGKKGEEVVAMNLKAVDNTLEHLHEVPVTTNVNGSGGLLPPMTSNAPQFVKDVLGRLTAGEGDDLPVSAFPVDGTFPTATAQYEKRNLALDIPVWDEKVCIQCLKCVAICPHATIRAKVYEPATLTGRSGDLQEHRLARPRFQGPEIHVAGRRRGLHRLRALRGRLPGQKQDRGEAQGHQHAPAGAVAPGRTRELELFPQPAGNRPAQGQDDAAPPAAIAAAALRVQRRVRRLRRDALSQDAVAIVRRPRGHRQRHRLLLDLRRQPADDAVGARTATAAGRAGAIHCLRTTRNSASVSASRSTSSRNSPSSF